MTAPPGPASWWLPGGAMLLAVSIPAAISAADDAPAARQAASVRVQARIISGASIGRTAPVSGDARPLRRAPCRDERGARIDGCVLLVRDLE